ncbi:MAG: cytochrome c biogenesis protein CcsA, partial [Chrysiogenetes bacterium]|nr:cytochrome c biogenesis protein CcsA [Chrysiogenetes bacterium]
ETWALITWLTYAAYIHMRMARGWSGRKASSLAIAGFGVVIFTYLGVNLFLSGLHSYGSPG